MKFKNYILCFLGIFYFNEIFLIKISAEINTNSIIKIFCLENVKSEMIKANLRYTESLGNNVCDCYLKNINKNISHERSILKCKSEVNEKSKSYLKE